MNHAFINFLGDDTVSTILSVGAQQVTTAVPHDTLDNTPHPSGDRFFNLIFSTTARVRLCFSTTGRVVYYGANNTALPVLEY